MLIIILESEERRLVDLVYVFGSTGKKAITWFEKEKNIAKKMIDDEVEKNILYGTVVYGRDVSIKSTFKDMPDSEEVKSFIDTLSWENDGEKLDKALEETGKLFKVHGRPKARKIAVVFVSGKADATTSELKKAAKKLHEIQVKIVVVKLGTDPVDKKLEAITPKKNIVKTNESDDPKQSAETVGEQTMKGKRTFTSEY